MTAVDPVAPPERPDRRRRSPRRVARPLRDDLSPQELLDLVASRSYVITMPEADRTELLARVREMPYITRCYRARLAHV
jgi:hypothetical protein